MLNCVNLFTYSKFDLFNKVDNGNLQNVSLVKTLRLYVIFRDTVVVILTRTIKHDLRYRQHTSRYTE